MTTAIRILPLGGLGEIGKNMMVIQHDDDIIVVDAGIMFPKEEMLGVDLVIPNIEYLRANISKIRGILITHGHEDHIGALPYVLAELDVPVYAPPLAHDLIKVKLSEKLKGGYDLREVHPGDRIQLGSIVAEYFQVCHSIPDACGIIIHTPIGAIVHTGDFKIDHTPVDGNRIDLHRMAELGQDNVLLLLSDSTYAEIPGYTPSEQLVGIALNQIIADAPGRVLVATFASLISRVQQIIDSAVKNNRKVGTIGRSMVENVKMALAKGYLRAPIGTMVDIQELVQLPPQRQVIVCTGAQGEPTSVLVRISTGRHREVHIEQEDTVIISASTIPGNETVVNRTIDNLHRHGAMVFHGHRDSVHVQGHASAEELKLVLNLIRPKFFIPVHGEYRMLAAHAKLAESVGIPPEHIFLLEDGDLLEISDGNPSIIDRIPAGHIYLDGSRQWDIDSLILRDRQALARVGVVVVAIPLDQNTVELVGSPEVMSSGFLSLEEAQDMVDSASNLIKESFSTSDNKGRTPAQVSSKVRDILGTYFQRETGIRPVIIPITVRV
jgi:ribonuclease J